MQWSGVRESRLVDDRLLTAWEDWERARPRDERALTRAAFHRLLTGQATGLAVLSAALGLPDATMAETVRSMVVQGLATADGERVTGVGGLSVVAAPHALTWNGRSYWTWCALDAIGIAAAIGGTVVVHSRTEPAGEAVQLTFEDGMWMDPDPQLGIRLTEPQVARPLCGGT